MNLIENYSLKNHNTFGVDVKAKYFVEINSENEIHEFFRLPISRDESLLILGSGSNILFTHDYDGVVLKYSKKGLRIITETENEVTLEADAGELWDDLVEYAVKNKYYGIENLTLIPGTVGAAPIQNIGAYGVELKDVLYSVEYYDINDKQIQTLSNSECRFGYRDSIFKSELKGKFLITKIAIKFSKEKKLNLSYKSLKDELAKYPEEGISIDLVRQSVKKIRENKLPDPKLLGNAGSFFKNPEMDFRLFDLFIKKFPEAIYFKQETNYKISAGWLIEQCGFKGKRIGNVSSYEKQALIIVNHGNATGAEIKDYADRIVQEVKNKFDIELSYEVNII